MAGGNSVLCTARWHHPTARVVSEVKRLGYGFTDNSRRLHPAFAEACDRCAAMKEDIIIRRKHLDRLRVWLGRVMESTAWLLCAGLLVASVLVPVGGALAWLVSGSGSVLATGIAGGIGLGVAGTCLLVQRLDRTAKRLCRHGEVVMQPQA